MKRLFLLFLIICFVQTSCYAKKDTDRKPPVLKYNGKLYSLLYSAKVKESNGYSNEYFKSKESYNNWTEIIAVHHFPTDYSPIDKAKEFQEYLITMGCLSGVAADEDNNTATIDFVVVDSSKLPIIMEFNIFRYQKDTICGTIALQYAKRYMINNALDVENVKKIFEKERTKSLKKFDKLDFPELISFNIENGKYILSESIKKADEEIETVIQENSEGSTNK